MSNQISVSRVRNVVEGKQHPVFLVLGWFGSSGSSCPLPKPRRPLLPQAGLHPQLTSLDWSDMFKVSPEGVYLKLWTY